MDDELDRLQNRIKALYQEALYNRVGVRERVHPLIEDARRLLGGEEGIGPWEAEALGEAEAALSHNFCRLALVCISNAVEVNALPADEYEWGFRTSRSGVERG